MHHIETMTPQDFDFAVKITNQMNWDMSAEDFRFMKELEPQGCFVLFSDSKKIGLATAVSYGKVGWFGNLIVQESHRNRGAGSLLVRHSIDYLRSRGVQTVGLYSYLEKIPFYERLGFKHDSDFTVLRGRAPSLSAEVDCEKCQQADLPRITQLDSLCFGADRRKLLQPILRDQHNICYKATQDGAIHGCLVTKVYDRTAELGPLLCTQEHSKTAIDLLRAALNKLKGFEVSMCLPKKEKAIITAMENLEFHEDFSVARMFLGSPTKSKGIYGAESLERG